MSTRSTAYARNMQRLMSIADMRSLKKFSFQGSVQPARLSRCVDGDTIEVAMIVGDTAALLKVRLAGIDAPELRPRLADPNRDVIKREGYAAKDALEELLPPDSILALHCDDFDLYGRLLATKVLVNGRTDAIDAMVERGFAVRIADKRRQRDWTTMWEQLKQQRELYAGRNEQGVQIGSRNMNGSYDRVPRSMPWWKRLCICRRV